MGRSRDIADFLGKTEASNTTNALLTSAEDGAGVTVYATVDNLPLSGNSAGDLAFVDDTDRFYIFTGAGWYSVSLVNATPVISSVLDSDGGSTPFTLSTEGASTVITITATDSDFSGLASLSQSDNVFTVTPFSEDSATTTSGTITFTASDGIQVATSAAQSFTLLFSNIIQNSAETVLLAKATGNSGTNSSFTDNSSSSHTITNVSDPVASSFSPYRSGGYSAYFDGTGDYLDSPNLTIPETFTIEMWFYPTVLGGRAYETLSSNRAGGDNSNSFSIDFGASGTSIRITVPIGSGTSYDYSQSLEVGRWYHIAIVRSSFTSWKTYLNGLEIGSETSTTSNLGTRPTRIGGTPLTSGDGRSFRGYITDYRIVYDEVYTEEFASPSERLIAITNTTLLACHLPYFADGSTNGNTITVAGNTKPEPFTPLDYDAYSASDHGGSAYFPSAGDRVEIPWSSDFEFGSGDFTIEFWYNLSDVEGLISWGEDASNRFDITGVSNTNIRVLYNSSSYTNFDDRNGGDALPNVWQHFAVTRDGDTLRYFINGNLQATVAMATGAIMPTGNTSGLVIGRRDYGTGGGDNSVGYFSDVRLVKGTAVYTAAFTPPTAPLSTISGTSFLALRGDASIFDTAQIHSLTLNGNAASSTGQTKNASSSMYFDGTGDYITIPSDDNFDLGTGDFTVEAWIYLNSISLENLIISMGEGQNASPLTQNAWAFRYRNTNNLVFGRWENGTATTYNFSTTLSTSTWYHVAVSRNNGNLVAFLDGTQIGSTVSDTEDYSIIDNDDLYIGRFVTGASGSPFTWDGYIEDLRVTKGLSRYPFVPPEETLTAITNTSLLTAHADTIIDGSTNAHTVTGSGNVAVSSFAPFTGGKSVTFDGTGDYLTIADDDSLEFGSGNFTIEAWVYPTVIDTAFSTIINRWDSASLKSYVVTLETNSVDFYYSTTGSNQTLLQFSETVPLNQWTHLALVRNGNDLNLFVNGGMHSTTNSLSGVTLYAGAVTTKIGILGDLNGTTLFHGNMSNIRVVKGTAVYTNSFTPPTSELLG